MTCALYRKTTCLEWSQCGDSYNTVAEDKFTCFGPVRVIILKAPVIVIMIEWQQMKTFYVRGSYWSFSGNSDQNLWSCYWGKDYQSYETLLLPDYLIPHIMCSWMSDIAVKLMTTFNGLLASYVMFCSLNLTWFASAHILL